jgi:hypothetical protein
MSLQLGDRDLAVLYYTWHNRLLCLRHYRRKFWRLSAPQGADRRIAQLHKAGYLRRFALPTLQERILFGPTRLGNAAVAAIGLIPQDRVGDLPASPVELRPGTRHDLLVVDIRIAFEESGADAVTWKSDHQLRTQRSRPSLNSRTPDGVFEFESGEGMKQGVLELEWASYHRPKLAAVLRRLRASYGGHTVYFVCRSRERAATFRQWCRDMRTWNDRPAQLRFGHFEASAQLGLKAPFAGLLD